LITWSGDPDDPLKKGKLDSIPTDPAEQVTLLAEYSALKRRARASLEAAHVSPRLIDAYMARFKDFGDYEKDRFLPFGSPKNDENIPEGAGPGKSMGREDFNNFLGGLGTER
jgi:hypothetical protein